jgi:hypothetical protein
MMLQDEVQTSDGASCSTFMLFADQSSPAFWAPDHLSEPGGWVGHIPFAFWIIAASRPRRLVELGTHTGNSYLAFCQAVRRLELRTACYAVDTWQGDDHSGRYGEEIFAELSAYHDRMYSSFSQLLRMTFDEGVHNFTDGSIDLLHIDGYHTYEVVKHDFETWLPKLSTRALVLMHDINVRDGNFGVFRFWDELTRKYPSFSFLHSHGLGVLGVGGQIPERAQALFEISQDETIKNVRESFAQLGSAISLKLKSDSLEKAYQKTTGALAKREIELKERDQQLASISSKLTSVSSDYQETTAALAKREIELKERDQQLASISAKLTSVSAELTSVKATLFEILNSRSWRYLQYLQRVRSILPISRGHEGR